MSNHSDHSLDIKGFIKIAVFDTKANKIVGFREINNVVTDLGRQRIADLVRGSGAAIRFAGVGAGTSPPIGSQTALQSEFTAVGGARKSVTGTNASTITSGMVAAQFVWFYDTNEFTGVGNNVFGEIGLFDLSANGLMFSRATYAQTTKDSNMQINFTYQLRFQSQ